MEDVEAACYDTFGNNFNSKLSPVSRINTTKLNQA